MTQVLALQEAEISRLFVDVCGGAYRSCACGHHAGAPRHWSPVEVARIQESLPDFVSVRVPARMR